jgi:threonine 3-dehydrogenase
VQTVFAGGGPSSKTVLIFGCGPIGIMAIELCRSLGAASVIVTDIKPYRLSLAAKFNPDHIIDGAREDLYSKIMKITHNEGVDILLEMSGSNTSFQEGLRVIKPGGFASLLGIPKDTVSFDITNNVIMRGINLYGIAGRRMFETWYQMKGLLNSKKIDIAPIITHRLDLDDFEKGIKLMQSGECGKVVMKI